VDYQGLGTESLLKACVDGHDPAAWEEFIRQYHSVIALSVRRNVRSGSVSGDIVDDLVQETFLKLCKDGCSILRNFNLQNDNSLHAFLKVVAANVTRDHFRRETAARHGGAVQPGAPQDVEAAPAPASATAQLERKILLSEIESHLNQCVSGRHSERDKQVFWFYYRHGFTADAIAALPNIGLQLSGVESTLRRLATQLREKLVIKPPLKGKGAGSSL
jgi:RNA polymerase sigma-70 factor (ECF subfamily)